MLVLFWKIQIIGSGMPTSVTKKEFQGSSQRETSESVQGNVNEFL